MIYDVQAAQLKVVRQFGSQTCQSCNIMHRFILNHIEAVWTSSKKDNDIGRGRTRA